MDTLGAVAICTEPYAKERFFKTASDSDIKKGPLTRRVRKTDKVIDAGMWRSILTQYAY